MNLLGRYLEEGLHCPQDLPTAHDWYRRAAEGGDFRGQFSHAAVLADEGRIDDALGWLRKALDAGNVNFLRVASMSLLNAQHPQIRAMADAYKCRLAELVAL